MEQEKSSVSAKQINKGKSNKSDLVPIGEFSNTLNLFEDKINTLIGRVDKTTDMVFLGFLVMLLMVIAIVFSYMEFVYSGSRNDDYKYSLFLEVNENKSQMKILKDCLAVSKWLNPKCLEN